MYVQMEARQEGYPMADELHEKNQWVETRDGQYGKILSIDKRGYCVLVDADDNPIPGKGHEPSHTLRDTLKALIDGTAREQKQAQKQL